MRLTALTLFLTATLSPLLATAAPIELQGIRQGIILNLGLATGGGGHCDSAANDCALKSRKGGVATPADFRKNFRHQQDEDMKVRRREAGKEWVVVVE